MDLSNLSYKDEHIKFVTGHNGTTLFEIASLATTTSASLLFREIFLLKLSYSVASKWSVRFCVDFVLIVLGLASIFTFLADQALAVLTFYVLMSFFLVIQHPRATSVLTQSLASFKSTCETLSPAPFLGRPQFITSYRSLAYLATAISILAVDFTVFPRRFCKAETFGTGVMDAGVAAFVLSNSIVAPEARGKLTVARSWPELGRRVYRSVTGSMPLIILGVIRLIAVKQSDYHEHVTEYGVHWNFFFTLTFVRIASTVILCFVNHKRAWLVALVIAGFHEISLQKGLKDYMLHGYDGKGGRVGFIDSNREGIFSCLGYLAIYFAGVQLGQFLLITRQTFGSWLKALLRLATFDVFLWFVLYLSQVFLEPVSRRLANASYITWTVVHSVDILLQFLVVDLCVAALKELKLLPKAPPQDSGDCSRRFYLLEAMNRNGLVYFLLANLFTGFINMNMATLEAPPGLSVVVIFSYLFVLSVVISILHVYDITIRFW